MKLARNNQSPAALREAKVRVWKRRSRFSKGVEARHPFPLVRRQAAAFLEARASHSLDLADNVIQQLRQLENDGGVRRIVHHQLPPKVEYSLTDWGKALCPALAELLRRAALREHFSMLPASQGRALLVGPLWVTFGPIGGCFVARLLVRSSQVIRPPCVRPERRARVASLFSWSPPAARRQPLPTEALRKGFPYSGSAKQNITKSLSSRRRENVSACSR
jgi:hypothetical protein